MSDTEVERTASAAALAADAVKIVVPLGLFYGLALAVETLAEWADDEEEEAHFRKCAAFARALVDEM